MHKFLVVLVVFLVSVSCKEKKDETGGEDASRYEIVTDKWPKKLAVDPKAEAILKQWPEYMAMDVGFDAIYNAANKEDLSLTIDDLINEQKLLEDSTYPKEFDSPQIKSRQKVFKTYLLKVKGDLVYFLDPETSVHEMIESYNIMREQFNAVVNHTLDAKLILDQE
ncbi:hypothetical protein HZY62_13215 [Maribacter polysiphoniae]|uniref:Uncharacterized protein n=1 Tax=Maribacter polysiphoniae TaxID=429344 RepID=A0A316DXT9_9FLAO|nr:hypothetical protein [Maribacter polysiphoniae]MBD1261558.1 hypothetical protein [Maribacter polysiphoniae]PWK22894.1 hypothetical protein LX92_02832 [Maribacter polysiphoniae]